MQIMFNFCQNNPHSCTKEIRFTINVGMLIYIDQTDTKYDFIFRMHHVNYDYLKNKYRFE